ncbi:hypothetical protein DKX38_020238 [Salix brachista]|uniref:Uncharacterized protein n=1 Tax=Salix brachista TaxID=2182728 RepID=A0A5N5KIK3_9ROSI|nr:hypothetical protein DKX38_020238 [Salix brachista]
MIIFCLAILFFVCVIIAEHHGPLRINCWQDPMSPSIWKEEHFVIVSLSGWGLMFYGGYKFFTRGKGKGEEKAVEAAH